MPRHPRVSFRCICAQSNNNEIFLTLYLVMSAVALRRKLLRERAQEQPGPPDENGDKPDVQSPQHGEGTRQRTPKPGEIVAPSSEGTSMSSQTAEAVTVSDTRPRSTRPVPE